jgi:hypothetical protein
MPTDVIIEPSSGQIYWNDSGGIGVSQSIAISGNAADKIKIIGYGAIYTVGGNIGASNDRVIFNDSLTSTVQPGANGASLGDATFSWDVYAYNSYFRQNMNLYGASEFRYYNATNAQYAAFKYTGASTAIYTLPTGYPGGTGTSFLSSGTDGTMAWVAAPSGSSSGTTSLNVNVTGAATSNFEHRLLFTTASTTVAGAALSQNSSLSYNPSSDILSSSGILVTSGTDSTNTTSGALQVRGGIGVTGTGYFDVVRTRALVTTGDGTIGGNLVVNGTLDFGNAIADSISFIGRVDTNVLPIADNSYDLGAVGPFMWRNIYAATGVSAPNFTGFASTSQAINVFASNTNSSHPILFTPATTSVTGAAVSSVSTVSINPSNSTITATTFSGALSGNVTGTATTSTTVNVATTNTASTMYPVFSGAATTTTGTGLSSSSTLSFIPSTGTLTATVFSGYGSTSRNVDVQLATTNAVHAVTFTPQLTAVVGSATSSDNTLVYNPSTKILTTSGLAVTALTETTSATTGAFLVSGSAGIARSLSIGTSVIFWNGANYTAFKTGSTSNQTYILPTTYPGTGTSVLASDTSGTMTWVASSGGGGGSGAVNTGVANKIAYYPTSTTTVDDATGMEYLVSGTASTVRFYGGAAVGSTIFVVSTPTDMSIRVGIGVSNPQYELEINGELSATNKSFVIDHPTKPGMKLRYGSLEGPENGVYVRGILKNNSKIIVPDHWYGLVDEDTYTVHLTPIGRFSQLYVVKIENYNVFIADNQMNPIHCYYSVWAERKDIPKLVTEY